MSIISLHETDKSNLLCKQFATMVASYFEAPDSAKTVVAKVPLENLFRVLEMYRYNAFSDESRRGVLAIGRFGDQPSFQSANNDWHLKIKDALSRALDQAFNGTSKEEAVKELQGSLRWLATGNQGPAQESIEKSKHFFKAFVEKLS